MGHKYLQLLLFTTVLLASCGRSDNYVQITGFAQGGTYSVKYNARDVRISPEDVKADIDSLLLLIDNTLSGYNKGSILSRFNAGENVELNDMFLDIYARSYKFYEETDGAFNVAAGPLFDIWGFGFTSDSLPGPELISETLEKCIMPETVSSGNAGRIKLNFNAIAQGYSCDIVAGYLKGLGVEDMLVDIGEIYCSGHNPSGQGWSIGVDSPIDGNDIPGRELRGILETGKEFQGVVTSGNYRKFYIKDGKKYAHTIDPRIGYPVQHNLLSATIIAPDAATADSYATYCMVIGVDEARKFIESREDLEGFLIYDVNGVMSQWHSSGFNIRAAGVTSH